MYCISSSPSKNTAFPQVARLFGVDVDILEYCMWICYENYVNIIRKCSKIYTLKKIFIVGWIIAKIYRYITTMQHRRTATSIYLFLVRSTCGLWSVEWVWAWSWYHSWLIIVILFLVSMLMVECRELHHSPLSSGFSIHLQWVPSHVGVMGRCRCDKKILPIYISRRITHCACADALWPTVDCNCNCNVGGEKCARQQRPYGTIGDPQ